MVERYGFASVVVAVALFFAAPGTRADTFINKTTGQTVRGALLGKAPRDGQDCLLVRTDDGKRLLLPAAEWEQRKEPKPASKAPAVRVPEPKPRVEAVGPTVCLIRIDGPLETPRQADVAARALGLAAREGAKVVILEIDSPGGLIDLARKVCQAIEALKDTRTVAFIKGGSHRGAFSTAVLVSMACDAIYLSEGCSIGVAPPQATPGEAPQPSGRLTPAFIAAFMASAQKHKRPSAIAAAMLDPDIELREVKVQGKTQYLPGDQATELAAKGAELGPWITRKGKVLTLTAREALDFGMADGIAGSLEEVLRAVGVERPKLLDLTTPAGSAPLLAQSIVEELKAAGDQTVAGHQDALRTGGHAAIAKHLERIDKCLSLCQELQDLAKQHPAAGVDAEWLAKKTEALTKWKATPSLPPPQDP